MLVSGYMIDMNGWIGFCTVFIIVIELEINGNEGKSCIFIVSIEEMGLRGVPVC